MSATNAPTEVIMYRNPLEYAVWNGIGNSFDAILFVIFVWGGLLVGTIFLLQKVIVEGMDYQNRHKFPLVSVSVVIATILSIIVYKTNLIGKIASLIF